MADDAVVEEGGGKSGLVKVIIMIVGGLALLGAGAGGVWFFLASKIHALETQVEKTRTELEAELAPQRENLGNPRYMEFDPPLTVNIAGDDVEHFLTVGISVLTYDKSSFDALNNYRPMLRNSLVIMMGDAYYEDLLTPEGKERLRDLTKETITEVLDDNEQIADIAEVYFTKFLMQ